MNFGFNTSTRDLEQSDIIATQRDIVLSHESGVVRARTQSNLGLGSVRHHIVLSSLINALVDISNSVRSLLAGHSNLVTVAYMQ